MEPRSHRKHTLYTGRWTRKRTHRCRTAPTTRVGDSGHSRELKMTVIESAENQCSKRDVYKRTGKRLCMDEKTPSSRGRGRRGEPRGAVAWLRKRPPERRRQAAASYGSPRAHKKYRKIAHGCRQRPYKMLQNAITNLAAALSGLASPSTQPENQS